MAFRGNLVVITGNIGILTSDLYFTFSGMLHKPFSHSLNLGVDFAIWNQKTYQLGSLISFPVLFYLNKKDHFSWTLIVLSPSRQHSFSDRGTVITGGQTEQASTLQGGHNIQENRYNSQQRIKFQNVLQWNAVLVMVFGKNCVQSRVPFITQKCCLHSLVYIESRLAFRGHFV